MCNLSCRAAPLCEREFNVSLVLHERAELPAEVEQRVLAERVRDRRVERQRGILLGTDGWDCINLEIYSLDI